jgi:hypothetical protein
LTAQEPEPVVIVSKESPRNRRRRRRVAVLIALVAALIGWWNWPRGDVRFVGKWELHRKNESQPSYVFHMHRNGGGWATRVSNGKFTSLKWAASDDRLTLGYGTPGSPPGPVFQAQLWLQENLGWHPWIIWAEDWQILEITGNQITIQPAAGADGIMVLRRAGSERVPESQRE